MTRIDEIEAAQASLPPFLRRDREAIEADEQAQELRRASFGRGHLTEAERNVSHGMVLEDIALSNLPLARNEEDLKREQLRYSEGLELQGRLIEAADAHPLEDEQVRLRSVADAIDKDDDEFCNCGTTTARVGNEDVKVHPHYEVKKVYSRKHGKIVSLVGCTACGELNASANPPEQLQRILQAHRTSQVARKPTEHELAVLK